MRKLVHGACKGSRGDLRWPWPPGSRLRSRLGVLHGREGSTRAAHRKGAAR